MTAPPSVRRTDLSPHTAWPLERILFLMAGTMTGSALALSAMVSPWFLLLTGFVATNQRAFVAPRELPKLMGDAALFRRQERLRSMSGLGPIGRLGRFAATHRRGVFVAWAVIAVGLGVLAPRVEKALSGAGWQANGSESVKVREQIDATSAAPAPTRCRSPSTPRTDRADPAFRRSSPGPNACSPPTPRCRAVSPRPGASISARRPHRDRRRHAAKAPTGWSPPRTT